MRGRTPSPEMRRNNVPPGTLIYDVNWSDFPSCFSTMLATTMSQAFSLYLFDQHPELAQLNERLSRQKEEDPPGAIQSLFRATTPPA